MQQLTDHKEQIHQEDSEHDEYLHRYEIREDNEGERIDKVVATLIDTVSRTFFQKMIQDGHVLVNGKCIKNNYKAKTGDIIEFSIPKAVEPEIEAENIPLSVLYEDEDVLVVDKPKDMVVHPAAGHYSGTLVNAVMYHCKDHLSGINGVLRPGIVHRIDKDTTGSLIICKNDKAHQCIAKQLKEHSIHRVYRAICYGRFTQEEGLVDAPIARSKTDRKKMAVRADGKKAITHFKVLKQFKDYAYIECILETGRTHQIRVHMAHINHPLLGDEVYGPNNSKYHLQGQCLHAMTLGFIHPETGDYIEVNAPLPDYFKHLLEIL